MKTTITTLLILLFAQLNGQYVKTDIAYYNENWESTDIANAKYKKIYHYLDTVKGTGVIAQYTITDTLINVANYANIPDRIKSGLETEYYTSGQVKHVINYLENKFNGELKTFYVTGQLKRQDLYKNDSLVSGNCYTISGVDTTPFPYFIMPEFSGGIRKLYEYLGTSINYPREARDNGVEGTVYLKFIVTATGQARNIQILRGIGAGCDEEAKRVIAEMPNWIPGYIDGIPVSVWYKIPIKFTLSDSGMSRKEKKEKKRLKEENKMQ